MEITKITNLKPKEHLLLLGSKSSDFSEFLQTDNEKQYLKKCLKEQQKKISINQFSRILFINISDTNNKNKDEIIEQFRRDGAASLSSLENNKIREITIVPINPDKKMSLAFIEGLGLSTYQFLKYYGDKDKKANILNKISVFSASISNNDINELDILIKAVFKSRDLVNEPLSYLTALQFSSELEKMAEEAGFKIEVLHKKKIESLKMGGLLAVNKGSIDPPTFNILEYKPENPINKNPIVLVGKGIVYDTGGLSLKPTNDSMDYMKSDMAGAAAVAGVFYAISKLKKPVHIIGLIPSTDNRPDGNAYVPGDVIKMYDGTTVEVLNTDAEGRMILADALAWAKQYNPELVIDIATLTGSAQIAVGSEGLVGMGNAGKKFMSKLIISGYTVHERIAEFPFWDEYNEMLKSDIADLKNIGGRQAGAITAGKFLEHFTDYPFIHLDIAGPAFLKKRNNYVTKGGSGIGVRLLYNFLTNFKN